MLRVVTNIQSALGSRADERGQTTAEYALVLAAVAGIVGLFGAWATTSGKISQLFDAVFGALIGGITGE